MVHDQWYICVQNSDNQWYWCGCISTYHTGTRRVLNTGLPDAGFSRGASPVLRVIMSLLPVSLFPHFLLAASSWVPQCIQNSVLMSFKNSCCTKVLRHTSVSRPADVGATGRQHRRDRGWKMFATSTKLRLLTAGSGPVPAPPPLFWDY